MVKLAVGKKLGRPCAVDAGETRKRLLAEARRSFATVGFEATTNRSIAAAAGITTGEVPPRTINNGQCSFETTSHSGETGGPPCGVSLCSLLE